MRLGSDLPLAKELRDPETREHTVDSQIRIGLPFQLRAMREKRGWTQETVAEKLGTTQNTISRLENPKTGKPTIKTLLRIARVFDVGLLVRFVPFGFYGDVIDAMDATHVEVPSYEEELQGELCVEPLASFEFKTNKVIVFRSVPKQLSYSGQTHSRPEPFVQRLPKREKRQALKKLSARSPRMHCQQDLGFTGSAAQHLA